jgi:predicted RNase H-like nuclease (RuvC/YqgF family)
MSKLSKIKEKLSRILIEVEMAVVKTDSAVLAYDGELAVDTEVYVTNEETGERVPAADGIYTTEDGVKITVAEGKVISIEEKEETPEETPTEEVAAEEVTEETTSGTTENVVEVVEETIDELAELKSKVEELENTVAKLVEVIEGMKKDTEEKFSKISLAKPATEEFEQVKESRKTGDAKLDKFLARYGNK